VDENEAVAFPENLDFSAFSGDELTSFETRATAEFTTLAAREDIDEAGIDRLTELADGIDAARAARESAAKAEAEAATNRDKVAALTTRVAAHVEAPPAPTPAPAAAPPAPAKPARAAKAAAAPTPTPAPAEEDEPEEEQAAPAAAPSLARAQERAPAVPAGRAESLAITAASPTTNVQIGAPFPDLDALVAATQSHARALAPSHGHPSYLTVATVNNEFDAVLDGDRTSVSELERMLDHLRRPEAVEALVAGGGWCAPSQIRYDFFNLVCEDGMVDLPTFGVKRGGLRFPTSPSLADVFTGTFNVTTNPWLWTETDDVATVTGSPNKPCVRVPCPSFNEERLECYGICLTAGNLTDNAYPESTRNHLKLLMSAHYHAMNQRYLQRMTSLSTATINVTGAPAAYGTGILADAPAAVGLAAQDYRTKYGMCDNDVLEVVFPRWLRDAMRVDHLRRTGYWEGALTDAEIDALFRAFGVRVQWVADYQVRTTGLFGQSTGINNWPDAVTFMIYAAGTFLRGNGMTLDLGVVRDSVLNAENDFTAAWSEECHLIARVGHESRQYTMPVCVAGRTGAANIDCTMV